MADDLEQMGPIDYLVVEFPGSRMTGEGLPLLVDLVDRGIIRILDLVFVKKELDGSMKGMAIADLDHDGRLDLAVFEGASSGLLDEDDIADAGGVLEPGSSAGILVYENVWAGRLPPRFGVAVRNSSRADGFRCRLCWPQSMPPKPKPSLPRSPRPESPTTARKGTKCPDLFEESLAPP